MGKRALVIDDDEVAREVLASILRKGGHEVFELPSPIGATQTIEENRINVVVVDLFMPSMDGDKFTSLLRKNPKLAHLFIVLVSSTSLEELGDVAQRTRVDAVVHKPQVHTQLLPAVNGFSEWPTVHLA